MNEPFEEPQVAPSAYGQHRRAAWLAQLQANADAMTAASMEAHQAEHNVITAGQNGLYGALSPEDMGAAVAARTVTVGTAWGQNRTLERNGGLYDHNLGPAPARRDLRYAGQVQPPGESPLARYMRERD